MRIEMFLMSVVLTGTVAAASAQTASFPTGDLGPTVSKSHPIALSVNYTATISNAPPAN